MRKGEGPVVGHGDAAKNAPGQRSLSALPVLQPAVLPAWQRRRWPVVQSSPSLRNSSCISAVNPLNSLCVRSAICACAVLFRVVPRNVTLTDQCQKS